MITELTNKKIFRFWFPLLTTWLMMGLEGPFIAGIIARLADAKFNLAAYGIAYSFAMIVESPVIMLMSASNKLVKDKESYIKVRNFTLALLFIVTGVMLILLIKPVYWFVTYTLMGIPERVVELSYYAMAAFLPWPAAIGYRRIYQGILISNKSTRKVAYGTIVRLISMAFTGLVLFIYGKMNGVLVGAVSLSVGVTAEAIASRIMAGKNVRELMKGKFDIKNQTIFYNEIIKFYYPLALTSVLSLAVHPMISFFLGQSRNAIEALAIYPVIGALVFLFRTFGLSYQEVGITFLSDTFLYYKKIKKFALYIAVFSTTSLFIMAYSPLSYLWYTQIAGLTEYLAGFGILPLQIVFLMPALTVILHFQHAILVTDKKTSFLSTSTFIEIGGIFITLLVCIKFFNIDGAVSAVSAMMTGRILSTLYLYSPFRNIIKDKLNSLS